MRRVVALCGVLLAAACSKPEGGIKLTYEKLPLAVAQKRLEGLKVKGATAEQEGAAVAIYLPGGRRSEDVKRSLGVMGRLEFSFVVEGELAAAEVPAGVELKSEQVTDLRSTYLTGPTREAVERAVKGMIMPKGRVLVSADSAAGFRSWVLDERPALTGEHISQATGMKSEWGGVEIDIVFDETGKQLFSDVTARGVKRRLAIILDGDVMSAPLVQERIPGGSARITLGQGESLEQAQALASALEGGALPEPVVAVKEEVYAPREKR